MRVRAPQEWNQPGVLSETQVAVEDSVGMGWVLEVPSSALRDRLRASTEAMPVFIAHVIRETEELFFSFETPEDRALFLQLTDLDSIGPKTAGQILASLGKSGLSQIIRVSGALPKISGVGPKTLEKLRTGLKLNEEKFLPLFVGAIGAPPESRRASQAPALTALPLGVSEALERLGLRAQDSLRLYEELKSAEPGIEAAPVAELVKKMLQLWGRAKARPPSANP